MGAPNPNKRFFWIDLEMTGLDEKIDQILEVAVLITDSDFKPVEELHRIVYQPQSVLDGMNDWCKKTHGASGLTAACATGHPLEKVEEEMVALVKKHFGNSEKVVLCGNSVGNDQRFLNAYMPKLSQRLHYRVIDVSSFKEVFREKYGVKFEKGSKHRAVDDILESISELQHYLSFVKIGS